MLNTKKDHAFYLYQPGDPNLECPDQKPKTISYDEIDETMEEQIIKIFLTPLPVVSQISRFFCLLISFSPPDNSEMRREFSSFLQYTDFFYSLSIFPFTFLKPLSYTYIVILNIAT